MLRAWLLVLLTPVAAAAADGSLIRHYCSGSWCVEERYLCDSDHTASDCAEIDLHSETEAGLPVHAVASLNATSGCAGAVTIEVRGMPEALGMPAVVETLSLAGVSSTVVDPLAYRFVDGVVATGAGCTDLEVILSLWYYRLEGRECVG